MAFGFGRREANGGAAGGGGGLGYSTSDRVKVTLAPSNSTGSASSALISSGGSNSILIDDDAPEIRKYKKKFNSDILCAALWGWN